MRLYLLALCLIVAACTGPVSQTRYDLVLEGGLVVDPESGLEDVRNLGIIDGRIAAVSETPLTGDQRVDVSGLVVAPGFINVHTHAWTPLGNRFEVRDGVTTIIEMESGSYPAARFGTYAPIALEGRARTHFGASLGHAWIRSQILSGGEGLTGMDQAVARAMRGEGAATMESPAFQQPLDDAQKVMLRDMLRSGLDEGGLGIGMLLDYMSDAVDEEEMRIVFEVAAERGAPISVHVRRGIAGDPSGLIEVIDLARETGAPVHICHLQASAMMNIAEFMRLVREARADGVRITMESFPYNAGSTSISAAVFSRDWQKIFAITYEDVEWVATGERLTEDTWEKYRAEQPGGSVVHHYNKEAWTRQASIAPDVIVAADGTPVMSLAMKNAPFGVGTFSRIYARYVRDEGALTLSQAVAKMTLLPARMLQGYSPAFARKGRLAVGADADITIFDLKRIQDHATFQDPFQPSTGIEHVIVGGTFALRDGALIEDSYPGQRILK